MTSQHVFALGAVPAATEDGADPSRARAAGRRPPLRPGASTVVLGSLSASFLATSSAPTPLYALYARTWHLTAATTSLVFGVYALSLLVALLVFGRLSEHIGRRPVLLAATAVQIVALAVLAAAAGRNALLLGRVLQGLSTGVGLAAVGAALLDINREKGTTVNSAAPAAGSAFGAITAALAVQFLPVPTRLIYAVLAVLLLVQALFLLRVPETSARSSGAISSMRPELGLPPAGRGAFLAAAPVLFAVWALSGLFGSLGPALVKEMSGSASAIYGALPLTVIGVVSPITAFRLRATQARSTLVLGIAALAAAVVVTIVAVVLSSAPVLLIAATVAGVGFGSGFRGGIQLVIPAVEKSKRAGTLSLVYIVSYLGFGVPAIVAGIVDAKTGDLDAVTLGYTGLLFLLAFLAAAALRWTSSAQVGLSIAEMR